MKKTFEIIGFCLSWFAIITQFFLMIENRIVDIPETIIRFFSFFTILTNILVAVYFTFKIFRDKGIVFQFFSKNTSLIAITTFILIVGLVYQIVLRKIWEPKGLQMIVDELLHTIIPLYVLGYWFLNIKNENLNGKSLMYWLFYPVIYVAVIVMRGYFSNYYPYPFLNIEQIGLKNLIINISVIFLVTISLMTLLYFIEKYKIKKESKE